MEDNGVAELHQCVFRKIRLRFSGRHLGVGLLPIVVCSEAEHDNWLVARLELSRTVVC